MRYIAYYPITTRSTSIDDDLIAVIHEINAERFMAAYEIIERHHRRTEWQRYLPWFLKSKRGNRSIHALYMAWMMNPHTMDWIRQEQVRRRQAREQEEHA